MTYWIFEEVFQQESIDFKDFWKFFHKFLSNYLSKVSVGVSDRRTSKKTDSKLNNCSSKQQSLIFPHKTLISAGAYKYTKDSSCFSTCLRAGRCLVYIN